MKRPGARGHSGEHCNVKPAQVLAWALPGKARSGPGLALPAQETPCSDPKALGQGRQNWAWPNSRTHPLKRLYISSEACPPPKILSQRVLSWCAQSKNPRTYIAHPAGENAACPPHGQKNEKTNALHRRGPERELLAKRLTI